MTQNNMGSIFTSLCLLLLIFVVQNCYCNEILENLVARVESLEEEGASKDERIGVLESKIEFLIQTCTGATTKVEELVSFSQHLNQTLAETENLVEQKFEDFNSTIQDFEKRSSLLYVPETCAQLTLLGVLVSPTKKEKIDPDGRSVNNLPIEVYCQDNGTTVAGEELKSEVQECSGQSCYEFENPYPENDLAQMRTLVDRSLECHQEVEIQCIGAPLQFYGEDHFHLIAQDGGNHTLNERHNCDDKAPSLVQETIKIKNKALLPLIGFLYGPLNVEGQFFSVTISRLICQPNLTFEASSTFRGQLSSLANKIDNNEGKIEENSGKVNQNEDDIETNQDSIVTHQNNIVTNQNNIETHQNNIVTNQNNIETNQKNVNKINLKIADHKAIVDKNEAKMEEHSAKVSQNAANIETNQKNIDRLNVKLVDHKSILDINEAKISQNEVNIETNQENIDRINVKIADHKVILDDNKKKITNNTEELKLSQLRKVFAKCQNKWCLQKGLTKPQHTKCESVTNNGQTCNNPEIKYGTTTGGLPAKHPSNNYEIWCEQLGGVYADHTFGTRSGYALWGNTGYDENGLWHWAAWYGNYWYNKPLTTYETKSNFIISITCTN